MMIIGAVFISIFAIILAAMAGAWRRACVRTAKDFLLVRQMNGFQRSQLDQSVIQFVTPRWVGSMQTTAYFLILISTVFAAFGLTWYWTIAWFFGLVILSELVAFVFPKPGSFYYTQRIREDAQIRLGMATRLEQDDEVLMQFRMLLEATE